MAQSTWKALGGGSTNSQSYPPTGTVFTRDAIDFQRLLSITMPQNWTMMGEWPTTSSTVAKATA